MDDRLKIPNTLRRSKIVPSAQPVSLSFQFTLPKHPLQRMFSAKVRRINPYQQSSISIRLSSANSLMPLVTTRLFSDAAATTSPPGHIQKYRLNDHWANARPIYNLPRPIPDDRHNAHIARYLSCSANAQFAHQWKTVFVPLPHRHHTTSQMYRARYALLPKLTCQQATHKPNHQLFDFCRTQTIIFNIQTDKLFFKTIFSAQIRNFSPDILHNRHQFVSPDMRLRQIKNFLGCAGGSQFMQNLSGKLVLFIPVISLPSEKVPAPPSPNCTFEFGFNIPLPKKSEHPPDAH